MPKKELITEKQMLTKALAMTLNNWPCGDSTLSASMGTGGQVVVWVSYESDAIKITKAEWQEARKGLST